MRFLSPFYYHSFKCDWNYNVSFSLNELFLFQVLLIIFWMCIVSVYFNNLVIKVNIRLKNAKENGTFVNTRMGYLSLMYARKMYFKKILSFVIFYPLFSEL